MFECFSFLGALLHVSDVDHSLYFDLFSFLGGLSFSISALLEACEIYFSRFSMVFNT